MKGHRCPNSCLKTVNFLELLPHNIATDISLSLRIIMTVLCRVCPNRMFVLPIYASSIESVEKYMRIWRNRNIYAEIAYSKTVRIPESITRVNNKMFRRKVDQK